MDFFNNNLASRFKIPAAFSTAFGGNRAGANVEQLNKLVSSLNCINQNTLREISDTFTITSLVPGPVVVARMNGGGTGSLTGSCVDCVEADKTYNLACNCGGTVEKPDTGKKRTETSVAVVRTLPGTYTVTITYSQNPSTPYTGNILRVGNPSEMSHIISVQKISNTEYTVKVFDSISGALVDLGLDRVPLIVTTFYSAQ